jgi:hypothetical protein
LKAGIKGKHLQRGMKMSTTSCNEFMGRLEGWMEGERDAQARAHAAGCASCRGLADDLDAIQSFAAALSVADPEPPARIWNAVHAQLIEEGVIRGQSADAISHSSSWVDRFFAVVPRPALAGAYMILLCAAGLGLSGTLRTVQSPTFPLSAELENAEQSAIFSVHGSRSAVSSSLNRNLSIVDNYISLCEKSVQEEPDNDVARDYLYQAYHQKADLLSQMAERGDSIQ